MTLLEIRDQATEVTTKVTEVTEGEEVTEVPGEVTILQTRKDAMYV